jgi:GNAT superfamily N-acetyltransferase
VSLIDIPPGHVGAVVTYLEMTNRPADIAIPPSALRMAQWRDFDPDRYRALFRGIGGKWLWFSRLRMDDAELGAIVAEIHVVRDEAGADSGLVELDFQGQGHCLIRFLALAPELAGWGHGRWLFAETLARAWAPGVERVTVHTCSLDHPAALPAYLRAGFVAKRRAFESFPDPRLVGLLPEDCAPQVPLIR